VRGMDAGDFAACCARPMLDMNTINKGIMRFMTGSV